MKLTQPEFLLLCAFLAIAGVYALLCLSTAVKAFRAAAFGAPLGYQDTAVPDYFSALRAQDLEELVEEEKVLLQDFEVQGMNSRNLQKAEDALLTALARGSGDSVQRRWTLTGEPYYQIYKNFDYWLQFNSQSAHEEKNVKLLLCLPCIPTSSHKQVRLMSTRLYQKQQKGSDSISYAARDLESYPSNN